MRSYSCFKHFFPQVRLALYRDSVSVGEEADTLAFPYGTFCKAIGVSLHDPDCHWLVMKASRAEGYPSHWGVEAGARGRPGGLEGASVGEAALLPVTHHAPLHDRQPCLACAQWEVWGSTVWAVIPPSQQPIQRWGGGGAKRSQNTLDRH